MSKPPVNPDRLRRSWRYRRARTGHAYRYGFRITLGGLAYIGICLAVGLAAVNSQINLLFLLFGIVLAGLMISGVLSTFVLTRLRAHRRLPLMAPAGQNVLVQYEVRNVKKHLASYSLHVSEHRAPLGSTGAYLPLVRPDGTATQRALLVCRHRGVYPLSALTVATRFPFSLFVHYARFKSPDELIVPPTIGRLTHDAIALVQRARGLTQQPQPRHGGEDEFFGLREYRHGDNPRWIHWRRSASTGSLVVREMSPPIPRRLVVLVSARLPRDQRTGEDDRDELLEKGLSLAATLIQDALRQTFEVGLLLAEDRAARDLLFAPPSRGYRHQYDMMHGLATFAGEQDVPLTQLRPESLRLMSGAQCVWITRGLSPADVAGQTGALAAWNISVEPIRTEDARFDRLIAMPAPTNGVASASR